jgi:hypothetical protein
MAKKVNAWPTTSNSTRYPWDQWLDGNIWALTKGDDFDQNTEHFRAQVYIAARNRGVKARTTRLGDVLHIQAR